MIKRCAIILLLLLLAGVSAVVTRGLAVEEDAIWGELLSHYVVDGVVDYRGFKKDEELLDRYLHYLDATDPEGLSRDAQLALYINAYNAYTVKLILTHFEKGNPPASIRKIGGWFTSPWKIAIAGIGGRQYTLDAIEHEIIRPRFHEPRIHFAVNCASKSCPPLLSVAYTGKHINEQLEASTRHFLADKRHNYLDGSTLYVSSIFKWYGDDFQNDPVSFFLAHSSGILQQNLSKNPSDIHIKYLDYDWSLNNSSL